MGITLWNFPQMHMLLRMTNGKTENIAYFIILIASECNVSDKKRIRLGIGESTRAITRYHLSCLLIRNLSNPHLGFIMEMASAKSINTHEYKQTDYECVAIIAPDEVL